MATPAFQVQFTLTRMPKIRLISGVVEQELVKSLEDILWPATKEELDRPVKDWGHIPEFEHAIRVVSKTRLDFVVSLKMDDAGQIYDWVNRGTGLEGKSKSTYSIPKDGMMPVGKYLRFITPYSPKTYPPEKLRYDPSGAKVVNYRKHVDHPGIQARKFTEQALNKFKDRSNHKGFFRVVENAYNRAFRWLERESEEVVGKYFG